MPRTRTPWRRRPRLPSTWFDGRVRRPCPTVAIGRGNRSPMTGERFETVSSFHGWPVAGPFRLGCSVQIYKSVVDSGRWFEQNEKSSCFAFARRQCGAPGSPYSWPSPPPNWTGVSGAAPWWDRSFAVMTGLMALLALSGASRWFRLSSWLKREKPARPRPITNNVPYDLMATSGRRRNIP